MFVEVLQSNVNKGKDKALREKVLKQLKKRDYVRTGEEEMEKQTFIW
jgi:hypothetical protein